VPAFRAHFNAVFEQRAELLVSQPSADFAFWHSHRASAPTDSNTISIKARFQWMRSAVVPESCVEKFLGCGSDAGMCFAIVPLDRSARRRQRPLCVGNFESQLIYRVQSGESQFVIQSEVSGYCCRVVSPQNKATGAIGVPHVTNKIL